MQDSASTPRADDEDTRAGSGPGLVRGRHVEPGLDPESESMRFDRRLSCLILDGIPVPLHWWIRQRFLLPRYRRMLARGDDRFCLCSYREHRA
ncbi:MAG: hypothetical protein KDK91_34125, partial [Gammaproteobacteria bacterium]|nr:hypothetical protein [Gammaproteobacteria bacterium]